MECFLIEIRGLEHFCFFSYIFFILFLKNHKFALKKVFNKILHKNHSVNFIWSKTIIFWWKKWVKKVLLVLFYSFEFFYRFSKIYETVNLWYFQRCKSWQLLGEWSLHYKISFSAKKSDIAICPRFFFIFLLSAVDYKFFLFWSSSGSENNFVLFDYCIQLTFVSM